MRVLIEGSLYGGKRIGVHQIGFQGVYRSDMRDVDDWNGFGRGWLPGWGHGAGRGHCYNHLLAECNILKKFVKIQSFYFPTVHNISKLYEIWRQKSSPASNVI